MTTYKFTTFEGWNGTDPIYKTRTFEGAEGMTHLARIVVENGDVIERPFADRDAAHRAVARWVNKFDKVALGASGTFYSLHIAA
jgi:hypothetical protein